MSISDDDLARLCSAERDQAIGFDPSDELVQSRELALLYLKGEMPDLPSGESRSSAVSTDVAEVIESALPDILEIFTGEDVATFQPIGAEDMAAADQQTDFVRHVMFSDNPGYELLYAGAKDGLSAKVGTFMVDWEPAPEPTVEHFDGQTEEQANYAVQHFADRIVKLDQDPEDGTFSFSIVAPRQEGRCRISVWRPEDVAVSADTVKIGEGSYCGFRSRVRRGQLLEDGYDPEIVAEVPSYSSFDNRIEEARDTTGVLYHQRSTTDDGDPNSDVVEIIYNYVRVYDEDENRIVLMRVVTGGDDAEHILSREVVDRVPAACIMPFPTPHAFYGQSLADKAMETQRIKTSLWRMNLDSGWHSLNTRTIVSKAGSGATTLTDVMNNAPGAIIRVDQQGAVQPMQSAKLAFDAFSALEYASTSLEHKTGVYRSTMGINADSLHDTAHGAMAMLNIGQRRVRFMARNMAEGLKDLFLLIHDTVRRHSSQARIVRLRGKWTPVDPTSWGVRDDMQIEVGIGSGGRVHDLAMLNAVLQHQSALISKDGFNGPLLNAGNAYATLQRYVKAAGFKDTNFYTDPATVQPQKHAPQPDPAMVKAQGQLQLAQQQQAWEQQHADAKLQSELALKQRQIELKHQLHMYHANLTAGQKDKQLSSELALKQRQIETETELEAIQLALDDQNAKTAMAMNHHNAMIDMAHGHVTDHANMIHSHRLANDKPSLPSVRPGGEPG